MSQTLSYTQQAWLGRKCGDMGVAHSCLPSKPPGAPLAGGHSLGSPYKHKEEH